MSLTRKRYVSSILLYSDISRYGSNVRIDRYCLDSDGNEALVGGNESSTDEHDHGEEESDSTGGMNCHFHAGVEYV